jgi:Amt family ammonium transporter
VILKNKLGFDDALDVWAVHGVGGMWGAIATGLFATTAVNPAGANGVFYGGYDLIWKQLIATAVAVAYSGIVTFILLKVINVVVGLRVGDKQEALGLDVSQHGEKAYEL